jgi:ATP-dependent Clp protease protease subunit
MTENRTWFTIRTKAQTEGGNDETATQDPNQPGYVETDDEAPVAEINIYDEIGGWGIDAAAFDRALKACGDVKTINMRINSPGGDSFAGIAIYNMLNQHPAKVKTRVDGIAASAASLIAMAGDRITMPENTFMVVHDPIAFTIGSAATHRAMADDLDRVAVNYANTYSSRSGQTLEAVRSLMVEDRLMTAAECKERGYCDETMPPVPVKASFALDRLPEKHRSVLATVFVAEMEQTSGGAAEGTAGDASIVQDSPAPVVPTPDSATSPPETDTPALQVNPPAYGQEEITATIELCALAGVPIAAAQKFIAAKTPVATVRARLIEAKAAAGDAAVIVPHSTNEGGGNGGATQQDVIAGKRRLQAIIKRAEKDRIQPEQAAWLIDNHR